MFGTFKSNSVDTDPQKVDALLSRGLKHIYPTKEFLVEQLTSGKRLSLYFGIDPTGPTLHLGHAVALKKLKEFQQLGHQVILLIGDFTAMIGDPTDKLAARRMLSREEVLENARQYKKQAALFLNFTGKNPARLQYNSSWLKTMNFADVLSLASKMTVDQMLKRDMFEVRMGEGKPIYIHEFLYPLLQGYDSVAMEVDGEIGGNDQTFNMLAGRTLLRQMKGKEKFVLTVKLLEDASGKKMGKTEGNMVTLEDSPAEMFGKVMSWTDGMIEPAFELLTNVSDEELGELPKRLSSENPKDVKMQLAREIVSVYYSKGKAQQAQESFIRTFQKKELPDNLQPVSVSPGAELIDVIIEAGLASSKGEFRRLIEAGAVSNAHTGEKITDPQLALTKDLVVKVGKLKFLSIQITKH